jgi:hypothetical protein
MLLQCGMAPDRRLDARRIAIARIHIQAGEHHVAGRVQGFVAG